MPPESSAEWPGRESLPFGTSRPAGHGDVPPGGTVLPAPPGAPTPPSRLAFVRHPAMKLLGLGLLWLLMLAPNLLIENTVDERAERRNQAVASVQDTWGGEQRIAGPFIVVPFVAMTEITDAQGKVTREARNHAALWLPATLDIAATQTVERRRKGLFEIPLYRAGFTGTAVFKRGDIDTALRAVGVAPADVHWSEATLLSGVTSLKSVTGGTRLVFEGTDLKPVAGGGGGTAAFSAGQLGAAGADGNGNGVQLLPSGLFGASVGAWLASADACAKGCTGRLNLTVQGSERLEFLPLGSRTQVRLVSDWPHPSFDGGWLPTTHSIGPNGHVAEWTVDELARGYPAAWTTQGSALSASSLASGGGAFGVRLVDPVDTYAAVTRCVKYAGLTVAMIFGTLWLFEMLAGVRLHPVQYALTAAALVLFGLVVLALAEHIGFSAAFLAAATTMTAMITLYARSALGAWPRALALGGVVGFLYGGLWLMLKSEDNALLGGTGAALGALAVVMWLTRRVDWYRGVGIGPAAGPRDLPPSGLALAT